MFANFIKVNRVSRYPEDKSFIYRPHKKLEIIFSPTKMQQNEKKIQDV